MGGVGGMFRLNSAYRRGRGGSGPRWRAFRKQMDGFASGQRGAQSSARNAYALHFRQGDTM